jgi:hypothetical protein
MLFSSPLAPARLALGHSPVLLVIVDAEEEFPWDQPFSRYNVATRTIAEQPRIHERIFDRLGIVPTYMVDWPVATEPQSVATLRRLLDDGRCEIGAQLHPWVSPPYQEVVSEFNSFAGNLPRQLEYEKLRLLTEAISTSFGRTPIAFKAGRYGVGPHTAETIAALGYQVDASVVPYTSFADRSGPDFSAFDEHPCWFSAGGRELLELPVTAGYSGWLRDAGRGLYAFSQQPWARAARLGAMLARSRSLERIRLSPEGGTLNDMKRLTNDLMKSGCQVYSLTYHSPSLVPGHTPYVRTAADREKLINAIDNYCRYFRDELGGVFMSLSQVYAMMSRERVMALAA